MHTNTSSPLLHRFPRAPPPAYVSPRREDTGSCTIITTLHEDPQLSSGTFMRTSHGGGRRVSGVCRLPSANTASSFFMAKAVGTPSFPVSTGSIPFSSSHPPVGCVAETQYYSNLLFSSWASRPVLVRPWDTLLIQVFCTFFHCGDFSLLIFKSSMNILDQQRATGLYGIVLSHTVRF